jgi:hypothetical protein
MRRSDSPIDFEDIELARQIVRRDPSFHETPHHLHERAKAPAVVEGVVPRLLPATDPRPSCKGKATVELMTVRLADLVNARMGTHRLDLCFMITRCLSAKKRGRHMSGPVSREKTHRRR